MLRNNSTVVYGRHRNNISVYTYFDYQRQPTIVFPSPFYCFVIIRRLFCIVCNNVSIVYMPPPLRLVLPKQGDMDKTKGTRQMDNGLDSQFVLRQWMELNNNIYRVPCMLVKLSVPY